MSPLERRLLFSSMALLFLGFMVWFSGGERFVSAALAASSDSDAGTVAYYGADISTNGGMAVATGVQPSNTRPSNGPWPQYTKNYCFLAVVQAITNYEYWRDGQAIPFPHQNNQGPSDANPSDSTSGAAGTAWQILYDMQHYMIPPGGPVPSPTGFTLADSSRDFGGDPRAHAYALRFEAPDQHYYHQVIYHNGVAPATYGLAKGVASTFWDGATPQVAIVNHALHSVVIAGVWANANPADVGDATIDSFVVYNPWDQLNFGPYLNGAYYSRVSYADWTTSDWWWGKPYNDNNGADPDPVIGIYQAGPGTNNPNAHYWIGNYVTIQRDIDPTDDANYSFNENGQLMLHP